MQFKLISPYPTQRRYAVLFILLHKKVFCTCQAHCPQGDPPFLDYLNPCFNFFPKVMGFCTLLSLFCFLSLFIPKNCALCYFTTVLTQAAFLQ